MTKEQLFKRAIHLNPSFANAYYTLGVLLSKGEETRLENGKIMSKEQFYKRAIHLNPSFATAYNDLGVLLSKGEETRLENGKYMYKSQLYKKAIELNPHYVDPYKNLGISTIREIHSLVPKPIFNSQLLSDDARAKSSIVLDTSGRHGIRSAPQGGRAKNLMAKFYVTGNFIKIDYDNKSMILPSGYGVNVDLLAEGGRGYNGFDGVNGYHDWSFELGATIQHYDFNENNLHKEGYEYIDGEPKGGLTAGVFFQAHILWGSINSFGDWTAGLSVPIR